MVWKTSCRRRSKTLYPIAGPLKLRSARPPYDFRAIIIRSGIIDRVLISRNGGVCLIRPLVASLVRSYLFIDDVAATAAVAVVVCRGLRSAARLARGIGGTTTKKRFDMSLARRPRGERISCKRAAEDQLLELAQRGRRLIEGSCHGLRLEGKLSDSMKPPGLEEAAGGPAGRGTTLPIPRSHNCSTLRN